MGTGFRIRSCANRPPRIGFMLRIGAIFIAVCMVLIAASVGAVLFLGLKLDPRPSAIVALAVLIALALYNTITTRLQDRRFLGDQIADLSRGTADLSRQMAEMSRRVAAVETRLEATVSRQRGAVDPIAAEIGELGGLVRQIAETVAAHETIFRDHGAMPPRSTDAPAKADPQPADDTPLALSETDTVTGPRRFQAVSYTHLR